MPVLRTYQRHMFPKLRHGYLPQLRIAGLLTVVAWVIAVIANEHSEGGNVEHLMSGLERLVVKQGG